MNNWIISGLAALVLISLGGILINRYGQARYDAGVLAAQNANSTAIVQQVEKHEKKKQEIIRLDDDGLVRRYCRWVYDMPYDECVATVKPIP